MFGREIKQKVSLVMLCILPTSLKLLLLVAGSFLTNCSRDDNVAQVESGLELRHRLRHFDGPILHQLLLGGTADMNCAPSMSTKKQLFESFTSSAAHTLQLKWVHKTWDNLVDPWRGDGRRGYVNTKIVQSGEEIGKVNVDRIPIASGIGLRIFAVNPTDIGAYACLLDRTPFYIGGLSVNLTGAVIISLHLLRTKEGKVTGKSEDETSSKTEATFFDAWTWQIYKFPASQPNDVLFEANCYADLILTGLLLRDFGNSFIRVGWKFTPRGHTAPYFDEVINNTDRMTPWSLLAPEIICDVHGDDCKNDEGTPSGEETYTPLSEQLQNIESAYHLVTRHQWRARWLRVRVGLGLGSGTWQCWLEGLGRLDRTAQNEPDESDRRLTYWLVSETRVYIVERHNFTWWNTAEAWRVLATWSAPACYLFFYLLVAIAWASASRRRHLLYQLPESLPQSPELEKGITSGGKADSDTVPSAYENAYAFEAEKYAIAFMKSQIHQET